LKYVLLIFFQFLPYGDFSSNDLGRVFVIYHCFCEVLLINTFCYILILKNTKGNQKEHFMMTSKAVKLSGDVILAANKYAAVFSRSVPKQIEHWVKIGRIAEENPDLPYSFIKDILISLEEAKTEKPIPYKFG